MKIGDLVRSASSPDSPLGLGVVVGEGHNFQCRPVFEVLWQNGDCFLTLPEYLEVANEDR